MRTSAGGRGAGGAGIQGARGNAASRSGTPLPARREQAVNEAGANRLLQLHFIRFVLVAGEDAQAPRTEASPFRKSSAPGE